ncbi:MAG: hypothetical protein JW779_14090 [Candidatus Thorarchaeota archaeon]|nr:hypothetical protein [Candidatus Thorarchaeota archaeon]
MTSKERMLAIGASGMRCLSHASVGLVDGVVVWPGKKRRNCGIMAILMSMLLCFEVARADGYFDGRMMLGVDITVSSDDDVNLYGGGFIPAIVVDIGYSFDNGLSLFMEFHYAVLSGAFFGSAVGYYHFLERDDLVAPYAIMGVGIGSSRFGNEYSKSSGPVELQCGCGVTFDVASWMEMGLESRLRVGVPDNPDVMSVSLLGVFVFKIPIAEDEPSEEMH